MISALIVLGLGLWAAPDPMPQRQNAVPKRVSASSFALGFAASGAVDGDRFSCKPGHVWQGKPGQKEWWWQVQFDGPRQIGAILQIAGDHPFVLRNAPKEYVWRWSLDGQVWQDLPSTANPDERRLFRIHRLPLPVRASYLRLSIRATTGTVPTLREVEFYESSAEVIDFPSWAVVVNTTDKPELPGHGQEFIPLIHRCAGWEATPVQQVWLADFNKGFVETEPHPLCSFLSGNFKDWCQIDRGPWRGTQEILRTKNLPIWASCGGAQGLAILAEYGVDQPWDCPHCRDPLAPKTPNYTHIGHTGVRPCGDYSACVFERGPHEVKKVKDDPVLFRLPLTFNVMESHCGQMERPPAGWELIATAGPGTQTKTQCMRLSGRYIYAAQFHIEMAGTPDNSQRIMSNFLNLAKQWGGWNPRGQDVP